MELPEEMIQHIHSFLNAKEVARTSILSKSWYEAWLTRPNLEFSEHDFHFQSDFMKVVKRTLERYERLKLKIQRFRLVLKYFLSERDYSVVFVGYYSNIYSVVNKWIERAMKLGAIDVDIEICQRFTTQHFVIPGGVPELKSLAREGRIDVQDLKLSYSILNYLNLHEVYIRDGNNSMDARLIEKLALSKYREGSYFFRFNRQRRFVLGVNDFHKLKVLSLDSVKIGEWLFRELSKSPCLKKLVLSYCTGFEEIQICSNSLEFIHLEHLYRDKRWMLRAKFDVPRIRKFIFTSHSCAPRLSFKTTSREWESCISFTWRTTYSSWYVKFQNFLLKLSSSKIHLNFTTNMYPGYVDKEYMHDKKIVRAGLPPIVEKLSMRIDKYALSVLPILVENLFLSCRPKFITGLMSYNVVKLLCSTLIKEEYRTLHGLEKVEVKISGESVWTWSCLLSRKTLDYSPFQEEWRDTQVYLQWR